MKITLIILCLILAGCGTAPKRLTDNELLLLTTVMNLQTQLNIQAMEKNRLAQLRYESNLIYHGKCKNAEVV